jgi:hypothetical protein
VKRGDVELGDASLGSALPVDPGTVVVVASAPGHAARRYEVPIAVGQAKTVTVEPGDVEASPSVEPAVVASTAPPASTRVADDAPPPGDDGVRRIAAWSLLGVGAFGVGVGAYSLLTDQQGKAEAIRDSFCTQPNDGRAGCANEDDRAAFDRNQTLARNWHYATIAGLAGGSALAATGVVLLVTSGAPSRTAIRVSPTPHGGVTVSGTW